MMGKRLEDETQAKVKTSRFARLDSGIVGSKSSSTNKSFPCARGVIHLISFLCAVSAQVWNIRHQVTKVTAKSLLEFSLKENNCASGCVKHLAADV